MIISWAHKKLAPRAVNLRIINRTRSAGESITGFEQVAPTMAARWGFSLEFNNLKRQVIPAYRVMLAKLRGRENVLRVPVFDRHFWPADELLGLVAVGHSDGTDFSDGAEYTTEDISGVTASGTKGDTEIQVDFGSYGQIFDGGLYFGVNDETYLATGVTWLGSVATIEFEPSLRQDHTDATFRLRPWLIMRLADDEQGSAMFERALIGAPSLELVEVLPDELDAMENAVA
jgi:hypothetical protein